MRRSEPLDFPWFFDQSKKKPHPAVRLKIAGANGDRDQAKRVVQRETYDLSRVRIDQNE